MQTEPTTCVKDTSQTAKWNVIKRIMSISVEQTCPLLVCWLFALDLNAGLYRNFAASNLPRLYLQDICFVTWPYLCTIWERREAISNILNFNPSLFSETKIQLVIFVFRSHGLGSILKLLVSEPLYTIRNY